MNSIQKQNLMKLDTTEGTGVFSTNPTVNCVENPTLIIGLGGLGGKTVNLLKGRMMKGFNLEKSRIGFLAIDSCTEDLEKLQFLDESEKLFTFDTSRTELHASEMNELEFAKRWENPELLSKFTGNGCLGIRQNGRILLAFPNVYEKVRKKLRNWFSEFGAGDFTPRNRLNITFVTGISGGTGGGMLVDLAYIVQDILLNEVFMLSRSSFKMHAYLYMPDVFSSKGISDNWLKRNGYATLKEFDYFFNLNKTGGEYKWPFMEGEVKNSKHRVFDYCTLLSPKCEIYDKKKYVAATVEASVDVLLSVFTQKEYWSSAGKLNENLYESALYNANDTIQSWMNVMGADTRSFPRSANYKYNIIKYGCGRVPENALFAYMAKTVFELLFEEYNDFSELSEGYIRKITELAGLNTVEKLTEEMKILTTKNAFEGQMPVPSDIHGLKGTYKDWKERFYESYCSFISSKLFKDEMSKKESSIIQIIDRKLEEDFGIHGPYFVAKAINASKAADGFDGILCLIEDSQKELMKEIEKRRNCFSSWEELEKSLDEKAVSVPRLFGREKAESFIGNAKQMLEKYTVEVNIMKALVQIFEGVKTYFTAKDKTVYSVYAEIVEEIYSKLEKTSQSAFEESCDGTLNLVNLSEKTAQGKKLHLCIKAYLTEERLKSFKSILKNEIKSSANRQYFIDNESFDAAGVVQCAFDSMFEEYRKNALERFLIGYYSRSFEEDNVDRLDIILNNNELKAAEMKSVAEEICRLLSGESRLLCDVQMIDYFPVLLREMVVPDALRADFEPVISKYFNPRLNLLSNCGTGLLEMFVVYTGIPLMAIKKIDEYDYEYDIALQNSICGIHTDEGCESDFRMFPAPFVYEARNILNGKQRSVFEQSLIEKIEGTIEELQRLDLLVFNDDTEKTNLRIRCYFEGDLSKELLNNLSKNKNGGDIESFLLANGVSVKELPIQMISDYGLADKMDNARIILRKNPSLFKIVLTFLEKYKKVMDVVQRN